MAFLFFFFFLSSALVFCDVGFVSICLFLFVGSRKGFTVQERQKEIERERESRARIERKQDRKVGQRMNAMDGLELGMSVLMRHALENIGSSRFGMWLKAGLPRYLPLLPLAASCYLSTCCLDVCSGIGF